MNARLFGRIMAKWNQIRSKAPINPWWGHFAAVGQKNNPAEARLKFD
jgi:hypothetical protein